MPAPLIAAAASANAQARGVLVDELQVAGTQMMNGTLAARLAIACDVSI